MCKIIQFPKRTESNGFKNLKALFEICGSVESCNFYLESAEQLYKSGNVTENELYTLRRIGTSQGRQARNLYIYPRNGAERAEGLPDASRFVLLW